MGHQPAEYTPSHAGLDRNWKIKALPRQLTQLVHSLRHSTAAVLDCVYMRTGLKVIAGILLLSTTEAPDSGAPGVAPTVRKNAQLRAKESNKIGTAVQPSNLSARILSHVPQQSEQQQSQPSQDAGSAHSGLPNMSSQRPSKNGHRE